jgi:Ca2+-binding RTX toxin-like protein
MLSLLSLGHQTASAAGPICTVSPSGDYTTIQAAVNDVGCSTINVAAGAYGENVNITRTLTLNGAQAGVAVGSRTSGGPAESTISGVSTVGASAAITIDASGVVVDGFSLKNSVNVTGSASGVYLQDGAASAIIRNNFIDNIITSDTGGNGKAQGVNVEGGPDGIQIVNNSITAVESYQSAKGIFVGVGSDPANNTVISGNVIAGITSDAKGAYAILINPATPGHSGLEIRDNQITNLNGAGWVHAISLDGDTPNAVVESNDISGLSDQSVPIDARAVSLESNPSFASVEVHSNNFNIDTSLYGVALDPSLTGGTLDATCNWWGDASGPGPVGPGSGALVSPNVDYDPWLTAPAPGGGCATVTVRKDFTPDSNQSVDITLSCAGSSPETKPVSEAIPAEFDVAVSGGSCTVSEPVMNGYYTKIVCGETQYMVGNVQAVSYTFDVDAGDAITCTFYNVQAPPECANIHFSKVIIGTDGKDRISGTSGNDLIVGLGDKDTIDGGGGNDCILGGDGNDSLKGSNGNDVIFGGDGNDTVDGGNGNDTLRGEAGDDKLSGGNDKDNIQGGDDNDTVNGGNDNDVLYGNSGVDSVNGSNGTDRCGVAEGGETRTSCEQLAAPLP